MHKVFRGIVKDLRRNGVEVRTVQGWKERGVGGSFDPVGVMFHHTASNPKSGNAPALGIVTHGRSDLTGPLSNFVVGRNGIVFLISANRCNHAGLGGPLQGVSDGNGGFVGVECENNGLGEPWPRVQKKAIQTLFAVLLDRMDSGPRMAVGHKEWTSRKIDPAGIEMDAFREKVREVKRGLR